MSSALFERPLPPALRAPLQAQAEAWMRELPMAGYEALDDAPACRLKALQAGRLAVMEGGRRTGLTIPVVSYLLQTAHLFVVDCGLSRRWRDGAVGEIESPYRLQLEGETAAEQLVRMGLRADRLVCTHLHLDHCGGAAELGLVLEASQAEFEQLDGYPAAELEGVPRKPLELDPGRPIGPFAASQQLAEGVFAVDTAGHTAGSISVLFCLGVVWGLICGDAVYPRLEERDSPAYLGMLRIRRMLEDWPGMLVLPGHDTGVLRATAGDVWLGTERPPPG